jgi:hypothetical protein
MKLHIAAIAAVAITGTMLAAGPVAAQAPVKLGVLNCDVSKGGGLLLVRKQTLDCTFEAENGTTTRYRGMITEYGVEIGKVEAGHLMWGVAAATTQPSEGSLAGKYVGAGAEASVGVGLGANVLVGGLDNSFALQPLSVEGQTGLNIAAGVMSVTLEVAE